MRASYADLAERFVVMRRYEAALEVCRPGFAANPHDERGAAIYLDLLRRIEAHETARLIYRQALPLHPRSAALRIAWARLLYDQGEPAARRVVEEALTLEPNASEALALRRHFLQEGFPAPAAASDDEGEDTAKPLEPETVADMVTSEGSPLPRSEARPSASGVAGERGALGNVAAAVAAAPSLDRTAAGRPWRYAAGTAGVFLLLVCCGWWSWQQLRQRAVRQAIGAVMEDLADDRPESYPGAAERLGQLRSNHPGADVEGAALLFAALRRARLDASTAELDRRLIKARGSSRFATIAAAVLALRPAVDLRLDSPWYERWLLLRQAIRRQADGQVATILAAEQRRPRPAVAIVTAGLAYYRWREDFRAARSLLAAAQRAYPEHAELALEAALLASSDRVAPSSSLQSPSAPLPRSIPRYLAKAQLSRATWLVAQGQIDDALSAAAQAAKYDALAKEARELAALAQLGPGGRVERALPAITALVADFGEEKPTLRVWQAWALMRVGRSDAASEVLARTPVNRLSRIGWARLHVLRLRLAQARGQHAQAARLCRTSSIPSAANQHWLRNAACAEHHALGGDVAAAQSWLTAVVPQCPGDYLRGLLSSVRGKTDIARQQLGVCAQRGSLVAVFNPELALAELDDDQGDPQGALRMLERAVWRSAGSATSRMTLVEALTRQRRRRRAALELDKLSALKPSDPPLVCRMSRSWLRLGNTEGARLAFSRIAPAGREATVVKVCAARLALAEGRRHEARIALQEVLLTRPNHVEALVLRARLRLAAGRWAAARSDLAEAVYQLGTRLRPSSSLLLDTAALSAMLNDHRLAFKLARRAITRDRQEKRLGALQRKLTRVAKLLLASPRAWARRQGLTYLNEAKKLRRARPQRRLASTGRLAQATTAARSVSDLGGTPTVGSTLNPASR